MIRHLLKVSDFSREECIHVIENAIKIKAAPEKYRKSLDGKTLLMIFEKPSLRTRVSFETGMTQLGGHAIFYSIKDSPLGKKENIHDTAKSASRYVDLIAARLYKRQDLKEFARYSDVPVINMLDDFAHPCQVLGDFQTIREKKGRLDGIKIAYFGDARNNVTYDLMRLVGIFGLRIDVACPANPEFRPEKEVLEEVKSLASQSGATFRIINDPMDAAKDSDIIYTDSWMSYGISEDLEEKRKKILMPFQVNSKIMANAKKDALFMHCLPAKRGHEQTADVIDGPQSIVFDQAENRLHVQKAIMLFLLGIT